MSCSLALALHQCTAVEKSRQISSLLHQTFFRVQFWGWCSQKKYVHLGCFFPLVYCDQENSSPTADDQDTDVRCKSSSS